MKEAIELLEKANIRERADDIWAFQKEGNLSYDQREAIKKYSCFLHDAAKVIDQALAILKQPKAQPTEFTKKTRERYVNVTGGYWPSKVMYEKRVAELCDRLDTSEASRKEMLEACKELIENEPHGITPYFDKALRKIEAAISNAGG